MIRFNSDVPLKISMIERFDFLFKSIKLKNVIVCENGKGQVDRLGGWMLARRPRVK
jgi:hypothetical protein